MCKSLLDPFGTRRVSNHNFRGDIQIDVLLAEANNGLVSWPRRQTALYDAMAGSKPVSVPLAVPPLRDPWDDGNAADAYAAYVAAGGESSEKSA